MEKLSKMGSFESFQLSKQSMNQISGSRTKEFLEGPASGGCFKRIDDNDGNVIKVKYKERYADKC